MGVEVKMVRGRWEVIDLHPPQGGHGDGADGTPEPSLHLAFCVDQTSSVAAVVDDSIPIH